MAYRAIGLEWLRFGAARRPHAARPRCKCTRPYIMKRTVTVSLQPPIPRVVRVGKALAGEPHDIFISRPPTDTAAAASPASRKFESLGSIFLARLRSERHNPRVPHSDAEGTNPISPGQTSICIYRVVRFTLKDCRGNPYTLICPTRANATRRRNAARHAMNSAHMLHLMDAAPAIMFCLCATAPIA